MVSKPTRTNIVAALSALALFAGCTEAETGPIAIAAIGGEPRLINSNLQPLDPPSAILASATAQGLVQFDSAGEIEPALAQSWIVSDDGLRYTFRLQRTTWSDGGRVTADQVASRLGATFSRASRNPLKPVLGAIENVVAMTDEVLEISLRAPRPNLLQLLAQPELTILHRGRGAGPYRIAESGNPMRLEAERPEDEEDPEGGAPDLLLGGQRAALAVALFAGDEAALVTGGTIGSLAFARAAELPNDRLVFDPVAGLFGLAFVRSEGVLADPAVRRAMSMAIDRQALVAALGVPGLAPRTALVAAGIDELPQRAQPDWATSPLPMRRELAARTIAAQEEPVRVRVAMPDGPGYRLVFAHLRRDWRLIGIEAERVASDARADLRVIDKVAPASLAAWYLRQFTCEANRICDPAADQALEAARLARSLVDRRRELSMADQLLNAVTPFIPLTAPVRWSLVSPRLTGFRPNPFAHHPPGELIAEEF